MRESCFLANNDAVLQRIRELPFFKYFNNNDINTFMQQGKLRMYDAGEPIIKEGDTDLWLYFLLSGKVAVFKKGKQVATIRKKGDLFGEMCLADRAPRSATILAVTETLTLGIDGGLIDRDYDASEINFAYTLFRLFSSILAERLRITTEENSRLLMLLDQKTGVLATTQNPPAAPSTRR